MQGGHGTGKNGEFSKFNFLHRENCGNTENFENLEFFENFVIKVAGELSDDRFHCNYMDV